MTATIKGGNALASFLAALPRNLEDKVLRGALRAGAEIIAAAAREECRSTEVRGTIKAVSPKAEKGIVAAKVQTSGKGDYKAPWLEHGTDPHLISVGDGTARERGRRAGRANYRVRNSLVIGGHFAGPGVHHPGARPHPFMRPAVDTREGEAIGAIGGYISAHLTKEGLDAPAPDFGAEE